MQQAGLGGTFAQGATESNNMKRLDSAANLRALINQQISLFSQNSPSASGLNGSSVVFPSNLNIGGSIQSSGIGQNSQVFNPQMVKGNGGQVYSYELLQRNGMMGGAPTIDNSASALLQLDQFIQRNGGGGSAFNFNGIWGAGGVGGSQGFPS